MSEVPMNARIVVVEGGREQIVPMSSDEIWVGRAPECALRVDDALVSRKHAVLRRAGDWYVIEDRSSANGTFVNEARVTGEQPVRHDDVIRCGEVVVRFLLDDAEAANGAEPEPAIEFAPTEMAVVAQAQAETETETETETEAVVAVEPAPEVEEPRAVAMAEARAARHEIEAMRRRIEHLQTQLADVEELRVDERVAHEDLKADLRRSSAELEKATESLAAAREALAGRDRGIARAEAEIAKLKAEADALRLGAAALTRVKDAGWSQANAAAHDAEQLREVIRQQVALLEERRVQILVLEARTRSRS